MSTRTSFAVHGAAFQPVFPGDFIDLPAAAAEQVRFVERDPSGSTFRSVPRTASFYAVVPSPSTLVDYLMVPTNVTLYYDTDSSTIRAVNVFDGTKLLNSFNVNWSGNHLAYDFNFNVLRLSEASPLSRGLIVVVDVDFAVSQNPLASALASVTFASLSVIFASGEAWYTNLINSLASRFQV